MRLRILANGDLSASAVPVLVLLSYAYDVPVNPSPRLSGVPDWRETYDIEAKAPANQWRPESPEVDDRGEGLRLRHRQAGKLPSLFQRGKRPPLNARAITMDDLVRYIENWTDLPVVNRTSLNGLFAVETEGWRPMRLPPPPPGTPGVSFDDLPTIFTVLRTLGLELTQQEATVPVYAVEHLERPSSK